MFSSGVGATLRVYVCPFPFLYKSAEGFIYICINIYNIHMLKWFPIIFVVSGRLRVKCPAAAWGRLCVSSFCVVRFNPG